ncbi:MAG: hypothetical protein ACO2ZP_07330 [Bacteriovoracaceae bacterium]
MEKKITPIYIISFIFCFFLTSCADLTKVSEEPLAKEARFYRLRVDKPLIIYHRKCKKVGTGLMGKRKCVETEINLKDEWSFFAPGFFLGPYSDFYR